jgi:predicted Zn-dependent peptidase
MDCGIMAIYAGIDDTQRARVEHEVGAILSTLATDGITATERKRAIAQLRASKLMSLESLTSRMTLLGKGIMEEGYPEDPRYTIEALESVSLAWRPWRWWWGCPFKGHHSTNLYLKLNLKPWLSA